MASVVANILASNKQREPPRVRQKYKRHTTRSQTSHKIGTGPPPETIEPEKDRTWENLVRILIRENEDTRQTIANMSSKLEFLEQQNKGLQNEIERMSQASVGCPNGRRKGSWGSQNSDESSKRGVLTPESRREESLLKRRASEAHKDTTLTCPEVLEVLECFAAREMKWQDEIGERNRKSEEDAREICVSPNSDMRSISVPNHQQDVVVASSLEKLSTQIAHLVGEVRSIKAHNAHTHTNRRGERTLVQIPESHTLDNILPNQYEIGKAD